MVNSYPKKTITYTNGETGIDPNFLIVSVLATACGHRPDGSFFITEGTVVRIEALPTDYVEGAFTNVKPAPLK